MKESSCCLTADSQRCTVGALDHRQHRRSGTILSTLWGAFGMGIASLIAGPTVVEEIRRMSKLEPQQVNIDLRLIYCICQCRPNEVSTSTAAMTPTSQGCSVTDKVMRAPHERT